jgi:hypothetical protein
MLRTTLYCACAIIALSLTNTTLAEAKDKAVGPPQEQARQSARVAAADHWSDVRDAAAARSIIYVDVDAPAGGDGASWITAFNDLQDALDASVDGNQLWIAEGEYTPFETTVFHIHADIELYGGFKGTETELWQRNPELHHTIINGDLDPDDTVIAPTICLFELTDAVDELRLDGLWLMHGRNGVISEGVDFIMSQCYVSGQVNRMIDANDGDIALLECTFEDVAEHVLIGDRCDVLVHRTEFRRCGSENIQLNAGNATFSDCTFNLGDAGTFETVGIEASGMSNVSIEHCGFRYVNEQTLDTIAVNVLESEIVTVSHCTFNGYEAPNGRLYGQGLGVEAGHVMIRDCVFEDLGAGQYSSGQAVNAVVEYLTPGIASCLMDSCVVRHCASAVEQPMAPVPGPVTISGFDLTVLTNCQFTDNRTGHPDIPVPEPDWLSGFGWSSGGAVFVSGMSVQVSDCAFTDNYAHHTGGGLTILNSGDVEVADCSFTGNRAEFFNGGGLYISSAAFDMHPGIVTMTVCDCHFENNTASNGGALALIHAEQQIQSMLLSYIDGCRFRANTGYGGGGAVHCRDLQQEGFMRFTNCLFNGNTALDYDPQFPDQPYAKGGAGGCFSIFEANLDITNCTMTNNSVRGMGSVLFGVRNSIITMRNCILWGNFLEGEVHNIPFTFWDTQSIIFSIAHSIVDGGAEAYGTGPILDVDPMFVDPANGDYSLSSGSPAIDAGDNLALPPEIGFDFANQPRYVNLPGVADTGTGSSPVVGRGPIDLGAFEHQYACPGDYDGNLQVDVEDFFFLLQHWGDLNPQGDIDGDGNTDVTDFFTLLQHWGSCA